MNLLFIGMPGSGKDTQAELLSEKFEFLNISTGELLRQEVKANTNFGLEAKSYMEKGFWTPDKLTYAVLEQYFSTHQAKKIIFNGAIRRVSQIELLDALLSKHNQVLDFVVYFTLSKQVAMERMLSRQRADDVVEIINNRFSEFAQTNDPIIEKYRQRGILHEVDASGTIEEIHAKVCTLLQLG